MEDVQKIKKEEVLPIIARRRLQISGGSLVVSLPAEWLKQNNLDNGSEVVIVANGDLRISPINPKIVSELQNKLKSVQ